MAAARTPKPAAESDEVEADVSPSDEVEAEPTDVEPAPADEHAAEVARLTAAIRDARVKLDALERELARLIQAGPAASVPLPPSVALVHPTRGHVVHVTAAQAEANGWTEANGWHPATPDQLTAAGLAAG